MNSVHSTDGGEMSTNDVVAALVATRTAPALPAVPTIPAHAETHHSTYESASEGAATPAQQQAAPSPTVPGTAAALPVAEAALRRALAAGGNQDPHAFALDLLRSVEALLRATAPSGMSPDDIGAAAARLVERQGLLARLGDTHPTGTWPTGAGPEDFTPHVDTRL
jgi:hypothetical protein